MHGYTNGWTRYVERYVGQNMMYWRSNKSLDVTGGFTFSGGEYSMSRMPGIEWGGDSRFFNDRNGVLFYCSRVRAFYNSKLSGSEPFIAYGIYRYDHTTGKWTALGGTAQKGEPNATDYNTVLYWETGIKIVFFFDMTNTKSVSSIEQYVRVKVHEINSSDVRSLNL